MGSRGPQQTPAYVLARRGSWRARLRSGNGNGEIKPLPAAPNLGTYTPPEPHELAELLLQIPGYDPRVGADEYEFDYWEAVESLRFIREELTHVKGELARTPFILEPWEAAIVANAFGWVHRKTGLRRYREVFCMVGRKNGKSPLAACLLLVLLVVDAEPGAEIYGAASEYKQASLVFEHARGMVLQNADLREACKVYSGQAKSIQLGEETGFATYRVISSEAYSSHGYNTHGAVIDELHTQPNSDLVDALLTSTGARRQPLVVHITTADFEREGSICNEKQDYAERVRDGIIEDPTFLPVIYKADRDDDWTDPKVWERANPNLGVSVSYEYLERRCRLAQETPRFLNTFLRLHLNIRTEQDVRWLPMAKWVECAGAVDAEALRGRQCFAGLDLSTTTDVSALVLLFPENGGGYQVLPFFWVPRDGAEKREKRERVWYLTWARQGFVELTKGNVVDYDVIRRRIGELGEVYNIREIAIDRWNSTQLQTQLQGDGFEVTKFGQGFASMSAPAKELEKLVLSGGLQHGGNPVLHWMAGNVSAELDAAGNIKPSKKKSPEKIDGIVALVMALGQAMVSEGDGSSVYETRGVIAV